MKYHYFYNICRTGMEEEIFFAEAKDFYRMEVWCSTKMSHAGAKYIIYLDYADQKNYIGLEMHSGLRKATAVCCRRGVTVDIAGMTLPKAYNFSVPCLIGVERKKNCFQVTFDEDRSMEFRADTALKAGKIGAGGRFTPLTIRSAVVSEGVWLRGKELFFLSEFYNCSGAEIRNGALQSLEGTLGLAERKVESAVTESKTESAAVERNIRSAVTESFRWKVQRKDHQVELYCGEEKLCAIAGVKNTFTFYYYRGSDGIYVLTDGCVFDKRGVKLTCRCAAWEEGMKLSDKEKIELINMSGINCLIVRDEKMTYVSEKAPQTADSRKECPLRLTANGAALQEYMRIM